MSRWTCRATDPAAQTKCSHKTKYVVNIILLMPHERDESQRVLLTDRRADHIRTVLKGVVGQSLRVGLLNGPLGRGQIAEIGPDRVVLECMFDEEAPDRSKIDLLLALPRPKVMKRLWAPLAALGLGHIIVTNANKVERNYFDSHALRPDFYISRLQEGLEQAGDTQMPNVSVHRQLKILVEDDLDALCPNSLRWVAHPVGENRLFDLAPPKGAQRILLAIGPDGGWTEYEYALLQQHGFEPFTAGPRIWRTEWASLMLTALAHEHTSRAATS